MVGDTPPVLVRAYRRRDDAKGTHAAYRLAITRTASADYEPKEIAAWVGAGDVDLSQWDAHRTAAHTFVAVVDKQIAGFVDFLGDGLLDMLFVHPDFGRRGIARMLVARVKREAGLVGLSALHTHASRTARPAFEQFGFWVVTSRPDNIVNAHTVPNYEMRCDLTSG